MRLAPREHPAFDLQMRPWIEPYLVPNPDGALLRCRCIGITRESRGGESQLRNMLVQLSVFAAQTGYHRIDHRNLEVGQVAAARLHPSRNLCSIHDECLPVVLGSSSHVDATKLSARIEELHSEAVLLLRIDGEMRVAPSARASSEVRDLFTEPR